VTVQVPAGIDLDGLASWFAANVPRFRPPFTAQQITGGRSNITVRLTDAEGRDCIIRRPPLHSVLATAHDVGREYRIIHALGPTDVPTPEAYGNCTDESVIGAPFYSMEYVDGIVLNDVGTAIHTLDESARHHASDSVVDAHVALHAVDVDAVGLGDLARHGGYVERQLKRWSTQWANSKTRELPVIDEIERRLRERIPEQQGTSIAHGDYRLGNCLTDTATGRINAVLDWELCTLGDPLADVGLLLVYWGSAGDELQPLLEPATLAEGFPHRDDVAGLYAERSGRDVSEIDYYVALALWKLAIILEGVFARYRAGQYGEAEETREGDVVELLVNTASAAVDRLD
jgi:aminoglycoside phosphotransferase (APT) family kinase protein